jgi:hypothetical protein
MKNPCKDINAFGVSDLAQGLTASHNAILFLGGFEKREDPVQSHLRPDPSEAFDCLDSHIPSFTFRALQQQLNRSLIVDAFRKSNSLTSHLLTLVMNGVNELGLQIVSGTIDDFQNPQSFFRRGLKDQVLLQLLRPLDTLLSQKAGR